MEDFKDDSLTKLADKAKRKLNKQSFEQNNKRMELLAQYTFKESNRKLERERLEKKVIKLLKTTPDCLNPIGKLIDHSVYDNLSESQQQAYVLKLANDYREIVAKAIKA